MDDAVYERLADVLDTLPNGFPRTESGMEIRILQRIFRPEDADLFCDLKLSFETAQQIAERTGRSIEGLEARLIEMGKRGQVFDIDLGGVHIFRMLPWVFGIYEFQLHRLDRELAEMCETYNEVFCGQFFETKPQLMQVIPIEKEIQGAHEALPFERVSSIIEQGKSFLVQDCICKKARGLLEKPCTRPMEVCMAIAPVEGVFDRHEHGKSLTKEEAYALLESCEKQALVHLTWNVQAGQYFICNCCGCCCGILRMANVWGATNIVRSNYYAQIDPDACSACGLCAEERCQVGAIEAGDSAYSVIRSKCIGCGLCVTTCPSEAIQLLRKPAEEIEPAPRDEMDWYVARSRFRNRDIQKYL
jgi:hypothetical protein